MQTTFSSSQAFIKALKSSSDPPQQGGPLKIALAEGAWQSETFQFPNKDEVIVEWILASFSREKTNSRCVLIRIPRGIEWSKHLS